MRKRHFFSRDRKTRKGCYKLTYKKNKLCAYYRRYQISQETLFKQIPNEDEQELVHDFFMKTVDHKQMSFKARWVESKSKLQFSVFFRIKPENSVWFEDAKLKNLIICQPENRNRFNKIFGGFIMRQAFELAWANAFTFRLNKVFINQILNISSI